MAALLYHPVFLKAAGRLFMPQIHKPSLPTCLGWRNKDHFFLTAGLGEDCQGLKRHEKLVEDEGVTLKPYGKCG